MAEHIHNTKRDNMELISVVKLKKDRGNDERKGGNKEIRK